MRATVRCCYPTLGVAWLFTALSYSLTVAASPLSSVSTELSMSDDEVLITAITEVVRQKLPPGRTTRYVAALSNIRPFHIERGDSDSIGILSGEDAWTKAVLSSNEIDCMVYWVRPNVSGKVKFIGVAWMKSGGSIIVYGSIPHPL